MQTKNTTSRRKRTPRIELPPPCRHCRPFRGLCRRAANGGVEPCPCPRGEVLAELRAERGHPWPIRLAPPVNRFDWGKAAAGDRS